jgi:hypothetical protein
MSPFLNSSVISQPSSDYVNNVEITTLQVIYELLLRLRELSSSRNGNELEDLGQAEFIEPESTATLLDKLSLSSGSRVTEGTPEEFLLVSDTKGPLKLTSSGVESFSQDGYVFIKIGNDILVSDEDNILLRFQVTGNAIRLIEDNITSEKKLEIFRSFEKFYKTALDREISEGNVIDPVESALSPDSVQEVSKPKDSTVLINDIPSPIIQESEIYNSQISSDVQNDGFKDKEGSMSFNLERPYPKYIPEDFGVPEARGLTQEQVLATRDVTLVNAFGKLQYLRKELNPHFEAASKESWRYDNEYYQKMEVELNQGIPRFKERLLKLIEDGKLQINSQQPLDPPQESPKREIKPAGGYRPTPAEMSEWLLAARTMKLDSEEQKHILELGKKMANGGNFQQMMQSNPNGRTDFELTGEDHQKMKTAIGNFRELRTQQGDKEIARRYQQNTFNLDKSSQQLTRKTQKSEGR